MRDKCRRIATTLVVLTLNAASQWWFHSLTSSHCAYPAVSSFEVANCLSTALAAVARVMGLRSLVSAACGDLESSARLQLCSHRGWWCQLIDAIVVNKSPSAAPSVELMERSSCWTTADVLVPHFDRTTPDCDSFDWQQRRRQQPSWDHGGETVRTVPCESHGGVARTAAHVELIDSVAMTVAVAFAAIQTDWRVSQAVAIADDDADQAVEDSAAASIGRNRLRNLLNTSNCRWDCC